MLTLKAEYGSWEYTLYWGFALTLNPPRLTVWCQHDDGTTREIAVEVSTSQAEQMLADADKFRLYDLPSTDYEADCSDDLYHMGVSVVAHAPSGGRRFHHQVPTGTFVLVPSRRASKKDFVAFSAFVMSMARKVTEWSGVEVPAYYKAKWQSRSYLRSLE